jgi:flagellar basal-body rod modification protein FlgD
MITPTSATTPAAASPSTASTSTANPLTQQQMFLKLLCAEMENQDPMNTSQDPTQYVTELAQFSSLEQLTAMHSDLDTLATTVSTAGAGGSRAAQETA